MTTRRDVPEDRQPTERGAAADREKDKVRVPAEPVEQRPGERPIGNGGTNDPAAFPPHN
ncbi:MAG TPA: hypothetical protein VD838_02340 [Anaeromyxobacteraceae bacterium]|nr:hypothetical protein [Anaeromyxobacteraceae bacterium]